MTAVKKKLEIKIHKLDDKSSTMENPETQKKKSGRWRFVGEVENQKTNPNVRSLIIRLEVVGNVRSRRMSTKHTYFKKMQLSLSISLLSFSSLCFFRRLGKLEQKQKSEKGF